MQCCPQIPGTSPHKDCSYVLFGENHIQGSLVHSNRMEPKPKKEKAELSKINLMQKEKAKADLLEGPLHFLPTALWFPFKKKTDQNKTENPGSTPGKTQRKPSTHTMNWCKLYARIQRQVVQFSPNFWLYFGYLHTQQSHHHLRFTVFQLGIVSLFSFSFYLICCVLIFSTQTKSSCSVSALSMTWVCWVQKLLVELNYCQTNHEKSHEKDHWGKD